MAKQNDTTTVVETVVKKKKNAKKKNAKKKIRRHKFSGKLAKPTAKTGDRAGTTNQHGRRLGGSAHFISVVLADAAGPLSGAKIAEKIAVHCKRSGVAKRESGSYSNQLNAMKLEELATDVDGGWQLTARGKALWKSGKSITRTELRKGRTLSELRKSVHNGRPLSKLSAPKA